jgi:hypothetical protein
MTRLLLILTVSLGLTAFTLHGQTKSFGDKKAIDISSVDYIVIKNHSGQPDTIKTITKRLTPSQTKMFSEKWNNAKSKGPCIYLPTFYVDIFFKDKTKRSFRVNGQSIKESNDYCFDIGEEKYFDKLWTALK